MSILLITRKESEEQQKSSHFPQDGNENFHGLGYRALSFPNSLVSLDKRTNYWDKT